MPGIKFQVYDGDVLDYLERGVHLDSIEERQLQNVVEDYFSPARGWLWIYHAHTVKRDKPGHPDLEAWHENGMVIHAELKRMDGTFTPAQKLFRRLALAHAAKNPFFRYYEWRPCDWQEIKRVANSQS